MKNNLISNKIKNKYNRIIKNYNDELNNSKDDLLISIYKYNTYENEIDDLYTDIFLENYKLNRNNIELYYCMKKGLDMALADEKAKDLSILFDKAKTKKDIKKLIGKYSFYEEYQEGSISYEEIINHR